MEKHVVFVHGLDRKPPEDLYVPRLLRHLNESLPAPLPADRFHVAYWPEAIEPDRKPLSADEDEYIEGGENFREYSFLEEVRFLVRGATKSAVTSQLEDQLSRVFDGEAPGGLMQNIRDAISSFVTNQVSRVVYERFVEDANRYFNQERREPVKQVIRDTLARIPDGAAVCLIGHSMGSFVCLDLILQGTRFIDRFVTIGSPLGVSVLQNHIGVTDELQADLRNRLGDWFNFFDKLDCIAIDSDLEDDFPLVQVVDKAIQNEFVVRGDDDRNHHKSYGYLRAKPVGEIIGDFLSS